MKDRPLFRSDLGIEGTERRRVEVQGKPVHLTPIEFKLVMALSTFVGCVTGSVGWLHLIVLAVWSMMAGLLVTSILSGRLISRFGRYRIFPIVGTALMTVAMVLLSQLNIHSATLTASLDMVVLGLGLGQQRLHPPRRWVVRRGRVIDRAGAPVSQLFVAAFEIAGTVEATKGVGRDRNRHRCARGVVPALTPDRPRRRTLAEHRDAGRVRAPAGLLAALARQPSHLEPSRALRCLGSGPRTSHDQGSGKPRRLSGVRNARSRKD